MKTLRFPAVLAGLTLLAACAQVTPATRAATEVTALDEIVVSGAPAVTQPRYDVRDVRVTVPRTLHVSEANLYYPIADLVWRGDARGDRYAQVTAIFTEAAGRATAQMHAGRPVSVDIEVLRFHALTEKTRYSVGGSYGVKFSLTVRDAQTGALIDGPRVVKAGHPASGGQKAIDEEARGLTEKVVVTQFLDDLLRAELAKPGVPAAVADDRISLLGLGQ